MVINRKQDTRRKPANQGPVKLFRNPIKSGIHAQ